MGGLGSGRVAKSVNTRQIQETLTEAGVSGAKLIRDYLRGTDSKHRKIKPLSMTKLKACIEAINHAIGLPKQKLTIKTDALTMKDIAEIATTFGQNDAEFGANDDVKLVPTKPLTARQIKERGLGNATN